MLHYGFLRAGAAVPQLRLADCSANAQRIFQMMKQAQSHGVDLLVFPELSITGYTCGDLFHQPALQGAAWEALLDLVNQGKSVFQGLTIVGLPLRVGQHLANCAAVFQGGTLLGIVPKSYLPNYQEFYEARWFTPAHLLGTSSIFRNNLTIPFGTDLLFDAESSLPGCIVGVEICEDFWVPTPPSSHQALAGAIVLCNLSASNEVIGKAQYRRQLVVNQSGRCLAGYVYSSCGVYESTTDLLFGGQCFIAENGTLLGESKRFERESSLLVNDIDVERLIHDRQKTNSFRDDRGDEKHSVWRRIPFSLSQDQLPKKLVREIDAHPFVPQGENQLRERCQEIFQIQVAGLARRLEHVGQPVCTMGVSGGLDSTLALLVACKTMDQIGMPRSHLQGFTMPGFGTTQRTYQNALNLMRHLGVTIREIDIRLLCLEEMRALGHRPFGILLDRLNVDQLSDQLGKVPLANRNDLIFENIQARMRTSLLMNQGFVIGTGDLSELALGWCTYNGDHMSMYNPNVSIPKTLVRFLVIWAATNEFAGSAQSTLLDIAATKISPELLPTTAEGEMTQSTEGVIGPYELHDFFLFHFLRYGAPPKKILFLADHAEFQGNYSKEEIRNWLKVFLKRFFQNQFKRSCLPDGPKVGSISLSPRGDWRMPSDANSNVWLEWAHSAH